MIGLAIHTSSPELGLALIDSQGNERSQVWPLGRDLTTYLHDCMAEFIQPCTWQDLNFIAIAKGPGGFTGTRIGVVVARTLAQQLSIPLFGISSLAAIAQHHQRASLRPDTPFHIAVSLRAQRGEVFGAIYQRQVPTIIPVLEEALYAQSDWESQLERWPTPFHLIEVEGGVANSVTGVLALAIQAWKLGDRPEWAEVLPFYGQHPVHQ